MRISNSFKLQTADKVGIRKEMCIALACRVHIHKAKLLLTSLLMFLVATPAVFGQAASPMTPDPDMPLPVPALDSVFTEELTWIEIREAMRAGKNTVIVASGGVEMNGPYLATGKHQYILQATTQSIARNLGNALVAPIVQFVPEGDISPPSSHMLYPGTVSVREETFRALLTDIAESFRTHGFQHIVFLSDSNGNVDGMTAVAEQLAKKWKGGKASIHYIPEYYQSGSARDLLESLSIREIPEGHHDNIPSSTQMMVTDPGTVRAEQRIALGKMSINGVDITPPRGTEIGRKIVAYRTEQAVMAIRKATGQN